MLPRPDVVFVEAQPITLAFVGLFAKAFRGVPYIYNTPDLQVEIAGELSWTPVGVLLRLARNIERHLMKRSFSVSTVTHAFIRHFHEQRDLPLEQLSFLPNGADTDVLCPKRPQPGMLKRFPVAGKTVFTYAGTHARYQGLEVIVDAAAILKAQGRDDIRIIMVGKGPIRQGLIDAAAERGIDNIIFGDSPFSETAELMSITDCALVVLRDMPAAEKMRLSKTFPPLACGVPVLFAGKGESSDLVAAEKLGWVCPPEDPEALAAAMVEIAADRQERKRRGRRGRKYVQANLSWKSIVADWLAQIRRRKESLEAARR
jgi:glycosyltransferase involved in cell wall biosynthesis